MSTGMPYKFREDKRAFDKVWRDKNREHKRAVDRDYNRNRRKYKQKMETNMTLAEEIAEKVAKLEARVIVDDEACNHLRALWNMIWAEWCYDPASESSQRFASHLKPHIDALNAKYKFK